MTLAAVPHAAFVIPGDGVLVIAPNGSLSDPTAPIAVSGDTYTLTDDYTGSILNERNGSTFDGANFTVDPYPFAPWAVAVLNASGVVFHDLATQGGDAGFDVENSANVTLLRVAVTDATTGFVISDAATVTLNASAADGVAVGVSVVASLAVSVVAGSFDASGTAVTATQVSDLSLRGNVLRGAGFGAVNVSSVTGLDVSGNDLSAGPGTDVAGLAGTVVAHANVFDNVANGTRTAFAFTQSSYLDLERNTAVGTQTGIDLAVDNWVTLIGNNLAGARSVDGTPSAIRASEILEFTISGNNLTDSVGNGLSLDYITHGTISTNDASGAGHAGFEIKAAHNIGIDHNVADRIRDFGAAGFNFSENGRIDFTNNHAVGDFHALVDHLSNRLWIVNSNLSYPLGSGIVIFNDRELQIRGTQVLGAPAGAAAIDVENAIGPVLTANSVNGSAGTGIYGANDLGLVVSGNYASHVGEYGIRLVASDEVGVTSNRLDTIPGTAIALDGMVNLTATGNRITGAGTGFAITNSVRGLVGDNNVSSSGVGLSGQDNTFLAWQSNDLFADELSLSLALGPGDLVFHNNFVADGGYGFNGRSASSAPTWDGGYPLGGNYWSNWTGPDGESGPGQDQPGADGIVDAAVTSEGASVDRYPLASPWTVSVVTFVEHGLPKGVAWGVVFNNSTYLTTSTQLPVPEVNGAYTAYSYQAIAPSGYRSGNGTGCGQLHRVSLAISVWFTSAATNYSVTFAETGLPAGTAWAVTLDGRVASGTGATLTLPAVNGTHTFGVPGVPGYEPTPASGPVVVAGENVTVPIAFAPTVYPVLVEATGLPSGTAWGMSVGGTAYSATGTLLSLALPNGTYGFAVSIPAGFVAVPARGEFSIDGSGLGLLVAFAPATYPLVVQATGLPAGAGWNLTVNGVTRPADAAGVTLFLPNGSYAFAVQPPSGWRVNPSSGTVTVAGGPASLSLSFQRPSYPVTFDATGLPGDLPWTVTIGGQVWVGTGSELVVNLPNGTYSYEVAASGFSPSPATGTLTVGGASLRVTVAFHPNGPGLTGTTVAPAWLPIAEWGAVAALGAAAVAVALLLLRRRGVRGGGPRPTP